QNSPLFQYLQDLGHTDFETCAAVFQEAEQCTGEEGLHQQDIHTTPRQGLFLKLADAILRLNPFQQGKASDSPEMQLDVGFRQYSLHTILEQEVLLQEDVELIELLDPSILSTGHAEQAKNGDTLNRASKPRKGNRLQYPLNSEIDNVTNYVSAVPLKELGLGLSEEQLSDEQAQELTDDYSLPALKVLFQLWVGQSSEFFRRLALLLSPVHMPTDLGLSPEHLMHQVVTEVTGPLHCTLTTCLEELRRSYEFHRYFETQHQPQGGGERSNRARQKCRELNSLYTAVRSLQLHLKALLNEVIILEDDLEKLMVSWEPPEMTCAVYRELEQKLKLIQPHMQASSSCWEEAVSQVDKMVRRATDCKGKPETPDESFTPVLTPTSRPVTLIEDRDPVPEEQELEAYVDDSESDGEGRGVGFDYLSPEERARQKKEGEESKRVLLELRSVLGLRASEMERQKWKQLLFSDQDNVTNYVSAVPLKELGLGLSEEQLSDEQAQELTDDYSLPALKVLFQLWVGQSSEFFRRLALLLSPVHMPTDLGLSPEHLMHQVVTEVTGPLHRTLTTCLEELRRSYEFHRYFETQHQPQGGGESSNRARQKCRELNSLYTAVRSLQLHLKALLNEVIILEDDLEKLMVSWEPPEMTCAVYRELEQKLKLIQPHMQASSSCWEEAVSQVDKMIRRATDCKGKPETPDESFTPVLTPTSRPVTLIEDRDPVPEEQELEAYVDDSESDGEGRGVGFDYLSPEERARQKKEGEESKRVLLELRSVLGLRASEMERQKWKQLLFSDQAILKPIVPAETLEPVGTSDSPLDTPSPPQEYSQYTHAPKEEGDCRSEFTGSAPDCQTEYCCALPEGAQSEEDTTDRETLNSHRAEAMLHYQYDGTEADAENDVAAAEPMPSRDVLGVLPATVQERLSGLHGSAAISFSSALAAQAAARSYAFSSMQEQTFEEDEGEGEGEDGGKLSGDSEE
ncbi:UNVERIFIED_CONTAM: hypothetical protein FKN15_006573, partial [Acipenser sinensis]